MSVPLIINGAEITGATYQVNNPRTGQAVHTATDATPEQAIQAVEAAAKAFPEWSQTTLNHRRDIFLKAATIFEKRAEELAGYIMTETGGDESWAAFIGMLGKECILACASKVSSIQGRIPSLSDPNVGGLIVKEPYGVVYAMAPW